MNRYLCISFCLFVACLSALHAQQSAGNTDTSVGQQELARQITALEHRYWEAWKHKDTKTLAQLRAEGFREVDQDGMSDKKQAEQSEHDMEITDFALKNARVFLIKPDVALMTYEVAYRGSYQGADISSPHAYVASVYQHRDGDWRIAYSQETPAKDSQTVANSTVVTDQALAKEREIQEAQRQGDWARFADLLSDDLVAIDEDGIRGKKELLKEIRTSDFHLSDYKMEDIRTIPEGNGVIVAYKQTHVGTEHGKPFALHIYTHSNWQRRGDKWVLTMYQDSTARADSPSIPSEQAEKVRSASIPQEQQAAREEIIGIERSDWEAFKNKNKAAIEHVRSDDYFDFGSDGRVDKAKVLGGGWMEADSTLMDFSWQDLQLNFLGDSTALVTYRGKYRGTTAGKEDSGEAYYTTLYQKRQGRWLIVFTQDSNLKCAGM